MGIFKKPVKICTEQPISIYISLNNNASSGKDAVKAKVSMQELLGDTNTILYQQLASFEYEAQRCRERWIPDGD